MNMTKDGSIRIAIAGVGNCASSLVQGLHYYTAERCSNGVVGLRYQGCRGLRHRRPKSRDGCHHRHFREAELHQDIRADDTRFRRNRADGTHARRRFRAYEQPSG